MSRSKQAALLVAALLLGHVAIAAGEQRPRPVINTIEPTSGPPGQEVKILGKNFSPQYKIIFGGVELKPLKSTPTELIVRLPKNAVQGRFTIKDQRYKVVSPQVFWVVHPESMPNIEKISPNSGAPGAIVTITGQNFSNKSHENVVTIGGKQMKLRSSSAKKIVALVPSGAQTGDIVVKVFNAGTATSRNPFEVLEELKIESIEPSSGPPGAKVKILGSGFSAVKKENKVLLGGSTCRLLKASAQELLVFVPKQGASSGKFKVEVKGKGEASSSKEFVLGYPPRITGFKPTSGQAGEEVKIRGQYLSAKGKKTKVMLGGKPAEVTNLEEKTVQFKVPLEASNGVIEVIVEDLGRAKAGAPFEVRAPLTVTAVKPNFALVGTEVRVAGTGFRIKASDHTVLLGERTLQIRKIENGELVFSLPKNLPSGKVDLKLKVKDRGEAVCDKPFIVAHPPSIISFQPTRGTAGTKVTLKGKYLGEDIKNTQLLLADHPVKVTALSQKSLEFTIPKDAQSGKLELKTTRRGSATSTLRFTVHEPVTIERFIPAIGREGQVVKLFGSGFASMRTKNVVTLGDKRLMVLKAEPKMLTVKVPKGAKTNPFEVKVHEVATAKSAQQYKVVDALGIIGFNPKKGPPGTYVTIKGRGFATKGLKGYLGQIPLGVRVDSPKQITVAVPEDGRSGAFVLTAPGAGSVRSGGIFKIKPAKLQQPEEKKKETIATKKKPAKKAKMMPSSAIPTVLEQNKLALKNRPPKRAGLPKISGLSATKGAVGDSIEINGSGFGDDLANVKAWVGQVPANVIGVISKQVIIEIPGGVKEGIVEIQVGAKPIAASEEHFTVK